MHPGGVGDEGDVAFVMNGKSESMSSLQSHVASFLSWVKKGAALFALSNFLLILPGLVPMCWHGSGIVSTPLLSVVLP